MQIPTSLLIEGLYHRSSSKSSRNAHKYDILSLNSKVKAVPGTAGKPCSELIDSAYIKYHSVVYTTSVGVGAYFRRSVPRAAGPPGRRASASGTDPATAPSRFFRGRNPTFSQKNGNKSSFMAAQRAYVSGRNASRSVLSGFTFPPGFAIFRLI